HRHTVPHLGELFRGLGANPVGQALRRPQLGKARLDVLVPTSELVVLRVRDDRRVPLVVELVVLGDLLAEGAMLLIGFDERQLLDCLGSWRGHALRVKGAIGRDQAPRDPASSRAAAARASSVMVAPASIRAISSRRVSDLSAATRVATRSDFFTGS